MKLCCIRINTNFDDGFVYLPNLATGLEIFGSFPLVIPDSDGSHEWKLKFSLGFDFLTGGSIG